MPDQAAQRAVQALGLTPRQVRAQARRWGERPPATAARAAYYRDLARRIRHLNAQIAERALAGADPTTLRDAAARIVDGWADVVREHGLGVLSWNARKYESQLGRALGLSGSYLVRTDALDPDLESQALLSWTSENVSLIKGATTQQVDRVTALVLRAQRDGTRAVDLEREIADILDGSRKRAKVVARDQIGKLNGQLDRLKQTRAGIDAYVWRASGDERVRPLHKQHNGKRYAWSEPPSDGHPGQPVQCRCGAEPDLTGVLGEAFAPEVEEPSAAALAAQKRLRERQAAKAARAKARRARRA